LSSSKRLLYDHAVRVGRPAREEPLSSAAASTPPGRPAPRARPRAAGPSARRRGFTLAEMAVVVAVVGVLGAVVVQVTTSAKQQTDHEIERDRVLEFFRAQRSSFVHRGAADEVLLLCPTEAGGRNPCTAPLGPTAFTAGRGLVAYHVPLPVVFPLTNVRERARLDLTGQGAFDVFGAAGTSPTQWIMVVDATSRVIAADGLTIDATALEADAVNRAFTLTHGSAASTILFRADGLVVTTWGAGYGDVVSARLSNVGARTTPNATPFAVPTSAMPARRVRLE
jgi:prepilin-type N-terminal cleavage/methylation domain-containing protein